VVLARGAVEERVTDVSLPGLTIPWSHWRSYSSITGGTGTSGWVAGYKWHGATEFMMTGTDSAPALYLDAHSKRTFIGPGPSYTAPNDFNATLTHDTGTHVYVVTMSESGMVYTFHDFDSAVTPAHKRGLLKTVTDRYAAQSLTYTYGDTDGRIT
jgi:hypothetical protein